ncbi:MAG TPA: APC family permease [Clostridia bacterium]|nr:APC family permease [Clostridia bacterium]
MLQRLKSFLIGKPLSNESSEGEKYKVVWGLPILSSDAISSVAYAGQEMLIVMIPILALGAFLPMGYISLGIIALLAILVTSYRQTIDNYPNGGGAYIVAKDNLGVVAGVTAGAALSIDYILTVAVSISSGVEQLASAFHSIDKYEVPICVILVLLIMVGNLRGIRESSRMFGIPAYAFMVGLFAMIVIGYIKFLGGFGGYIESVPPTITNIAQPLTIMLLLRAFSSGCSALTGIEAVSNSVPNFKEPSVKHAKLVLVLLGCIIFVLFGGTAILANIYKVDPRGGALLVLIAQQIFGNGSFMFFYISITTFIILIMAANTAYSGFPLLLSVMAKEGYAPRQLSMRGDRLSYSNGIILLSSATIVLIIIFSAKVTSLIGLYAVGVFVSFTLSQSGMFKRWLKIRGNHWHVKSAINGFGAIVTLIIVVIIASTKFRDGAWIVVLLIPILVFLILKVKKHYSSVSVQLSMTKDELNEIDFDRDVYINRVIVPIESVNKTSVRAIRYAKTISDNVTAFNVSIDEESGDKIREKYDMLDTDIPLIVKYSPFRKIVEPLLEFIESAEYEYRKGDMITVMLPQFTTKRLWHRLLHNGSRAYIERQLLKHKHIVVSVMPLQLKD